MTLSELLSFLRWTLNAYHYNCIISTLEKSVKHDKIFSKEAKQGIQKIINYMDTEYSRTRYIEKISLSKTLNKASNLIRIKIIIRLALLHGITFTETKMKSSKYLGKTNYFIYQKEHNAQLKTALNKC